MRESLGNSLRDNGVCIIGAGPAGLAVGAQLKKSGVPIRILEKSNAIATSWRSAYDRLRLHSARGLSGLPGLPMPRAYGMWPSRDDVINYLESYRAAFGLDIETNTEVARIERAPTDRPESVRWNVVTVSGDVIPASAVVIATGNNHTPYVPDWPGRASFTGRLLHARDYRNAQPFVGQDVLVAGIGNTGVDIAVDLADGGARHVTLAMRTAPHIVRRDIAGVPNQLTGIVIDRMPPRVVDAIAKWQARISLPDLTTYGLPRPDVGLGTRVRRDRRVPVQDVGIVAAIRAGSVVPVPGIAEIDGGTVTLTDGRSLTPDVIITATGYRPQLAELVGGLDVLSPRGLPRSLGGRAPKPGLYFVGYDVNLSGALRQIGIEARQVTSSIRRGWRPSEPRRPACAPAAGE